MLAFKAPFSFEGRIGRKDFILVAVTAYIMSSITVLILYSVLSEFRVFERHSSNLNYSYIDSEKTFFVSSIVYIPYLWYLLAQGAKRLHDLNLSGWIQIVYPIAFLIMIFKKGDAQDNQYGPALRWVKSKHPMNEDEFSIASTENGKRYKPETIPVICPICKSPNPSKKSVCDWCGSEIT